MQLIGVSLYSRNFARLGVEAAHDEGASDEDAEKVSAWDRMYRIWPRPYAESALGRIWVDALELVPCQDSGHYVPAFVNDDDHHLSQERIRDYTKVHFDIQPVLISSQPSHLQWVQEIPDNSKVPADEDDKKHDGHRS